MKSAFGVDHVSKAYDPERKRKQRAQAYVAGSGAGAVAAGGTAAVMVPRGVKREIDSQKRNYKTNVVNARASQVEGLRTKMRETKQKSRAARGEIKRLRMGHAAYQQRNDVVRREVDNVASHGKKIKALEQSLANFNGPKAAPRGYKGGGKVAADPQIYAELKGKLAVAQGEQAAAKQKAGANIRAARKSAKVAVYNEARDARFPLGRAHREKRAGGKEFMDTKRRLVALKNSPLPKYKTNKTAILRARGVKGGLALAGTSAALGAGSVAMNRYRKKDTFQSYS